MVALSLKLQVSIMTSCCNTKVSPFCCVSDTISGASTTEKNGGSRTPTEGTPQAEDVKNLCTDFAYDASTTVTGNDDVNYFDDRMATMATNETDIDAEEIVNKPRSEVIFGTPLHSDSKTVFVIEGSRKEVSSDTVDTESSQNSDENVEDMAKEGVGLLGLSLGGAPCGDIAKEYEVDLEFDSRICEPGLDSQGDFREEEVYNSLDEKQLKDTMIAGRIGMPSDWEFAHYTSEADEVEDTLSSVPDEANATHMPIETIKSKYEEELAVLETEIGALPLARESSVPAEQNLEAEEVLRKEVSILRDDLHGGHAPETGAGEKIVNARKEETIVVPENITSSFLAERSTSLGVKDDFRQAFSDQKILADVQSEEMISEFNGKITQESTCKPSEGKPKGDGLTNWMPDITSVANVVSGVSTLVNWNANSETPEGVDPQTYKPEVGKSNGDEFIPSGFHFGNLTQSAAAISDWIPDLSISSYLPNLSPDIPLNEGKQADVEEVVAELTVDETEEERKSAIDWCVDWFRYPSIFYVLLVLAMTLLASATQMNPALVVLVVALCSLVGFRLFPVHGSQHK